MGWHAVKSNQSITCKFFKRYEFCPTLFTVISFNELICKKKKKDETKKKEKREITEDKLWVFPLDHSSM